MYATSFHMYYHVDDLIGFPHVFTTNSHLVGISDVRRRTSSIVILLHSSCSKPFSSCKDLQTRRRILCFKIFQHASMGFKLGDWGRCTWLLIQLVSFKWCASPGFRVPWLGSLFSCSSQYWGIVGFEKFTFLDGIEFADLDWLIRSRFTIGRASCGCHRVVVLSYSFIHSLSTSTRLTLGVSHELCHTLVSCVTRLLFLSFFFFFLSFLCCSVCESLPCAPRPSHTWHFVVLFRISHIPYSTISSSWTQRNPF